MSAQQKTKKEERVFEKVDKDAEFIGGSSAWVHYFNKNLHFSDSCLTDEHLSLAGSYLFSFIVYKDGSVGSVSLLRGEECIGKSCARTIQSSSGMWKPAFVNKQPVNSLVKFPVSCIKFESE